MRRVWEHKNLKLPGFTSRYNLNKLVYYEIFQSSYEAVSREKQLKAGSRKRKELLIESTNPLWKALFEEII